MGEKHGFFSKFIGFLFILFIIGSIGAIIWYIIGNPPKLFEEEEKKTREITPLMYEVTKEGSSNKLYLFGSMHVVNLGEFDFPKYVMDAYENSDYLAVEADVVKFEQNLTTEQAQSIILYKDNSMLKDHISPEVYKDLKDYLNEKKIYNEMYESFNASALCDILQDRLIKKAGLIGDGVDQHFIKKAYKDKKEILEVESIEFQLNLTNGFPDKFYEYELISIITTPEEEIIKQYQDLYSDWKKGKELVDETKEEIDEKDKEIIKKYNIDEKELIEIVADYNKKLLDDRNIGMADKAESYFEDGKKVLFMVGAAHLPGDKGIAELLRNKGYTVKKVN